MRALASHFGVGKDTVAQALGRLIDLGANLDDVTALSLRPDDLGYDAIRSARVVNDTIERLRQAGATFRQPFAMQVDAQRLPELL